MTSQTTPQSTLPLAAGRWELDPAHSTVSFAVRHLGVSKVRGSFRDFTADVVVGDDLATTSVAAVVQLASVDTGNADRDAHLQADDMFDVANRPTIAFRSTGVAPDGDGWRLDGDLTIGEITRPVSLAVELGGLEEFPGDGRVHAGFEATGELNRKDFDIAAAVPGAMLSDKVKIDLDLQLVAPVS